MYPYRRFDTSTGDLKTVECSACFCLVRDDDFSRGKHAEWHKNLNAIAQNAQEGAQVAMLHTRIG